MYKQLQENLARPGWLRGEGDSGARANFYSNKQGLSRLPNENSVQKEL